MPAAMLLVLALLWWRSRADTSHPTDEPSPANTSARSSGGDQLGGFGDSDSERSRAALFPPTRPRKGPGQVEGRVIDVSNKQPVPGVDVIFHARGGDQTTTSDSDGNFTATLVPATYEVRAAGSDVVSVPGPVLEVLGGPDPIRFDVRVQRLARVAGSVVDSSGRGVAGAEVSFAPVTRLEKKQLSFGELDSSTTTDDTGRFGLAVKAVAPVFLAASAGERWGYARVDDVVPGATRDGVVIELSDAVVRGLVVTPDGAPAAGAEVRLVSRDHGFKRSRDATTDRQGRFELTEVMPGKGWIEARMDPFAASVPTKIDLAPRQQLEIELALQPPLVIAGHVIDPSGEPVDQARVRAGRLHSQMGSLEVYTDVNGEFRFDQLDSGPYWVGAYRPEFAVGEVKSIKPPVADLELRLLSFGGIQGHVQEIGGKPVDNFDVVVVERTRVGQNKPRRLDERSHHTDPDGNFQLYPLEPGTYKLKVSAGGRGKAVLDGVEVAGDKATSVTATLTK